MRGQASQCRENMHFSMPPEVNAVDLMSDAETDRGLLDTLLARLPEFGVYPFEARGESTGFIFNRIWAAIKRESLAVIAEGMARPEDVDGMFTVNLAMSICSGPTVTGQIPVNVATVRVAH